MYDLHTFRQLLKVEKEGVIINSDNSISVWLNVELADKVNDDDLKSCFDTDASEIKIVRNSDNNFNVECVYKSNYSEKSYIVYNGENINSSEKGEVILDHFNPDEFTVLSSYYNRSDREYKIFMSQKIDELQDLTGLITINKKNAEYTIDKNTIVIYLGKYKTESNIGIVLHKGIKSKVKMLEGDYTFNVVKEVENPEVQFAMEGNYFLFKW
ncbi:MAG: hypothetical protein R2771_04155 [Saprospiraceae bacterium]